MGEKLFSDCATCKAPRSTRHCDVCNSTFCDRCWCTCSLQAEMAGDILAIMQRLGGAATVPDLVAAASGYSAEVIVRALELAQRNGEVNRWGSAPLAEDLWYANYPAAMQHMLRARKKRKAKPCLFCGVTGCKGCVGEVEPEPSPEPTICPRCQLDQSDHRTLWHACLAEMDEATCHAGVVPWEQMTLRGTVEVEANSALLYQFYLVSVCKHCRGDWLRAIGTWWSNPPALCPNRLHYADDCSCEPEPKPAPLDCACGLSISMRGAEGPVLYALAYAHGWSCDPIGQWLCAQCKGGKR